MLLVDTHCHLTSGRFATDLPEILARARAGRVHRLITIGTGIDDAEAALALAAAHPDLIHAAAGLDPFSCHAAGAAIDAEFARLDVLLGSGRLVAVGECGLEYHHPVCPPAVQAEHFVRHLDLARHHQLPVVVHVRDAFHDLLPILAAHRGVGGVIHSFSGDPAQARACLDLGWHLSINGMVTYKGNDALREAVRMIPNDRLLVETDAPYLTPVPLRGQRNEPAHVALSAAAIAELRGERSDDLEAWTTFNACRLFKLPLPDGWS
jgi:TatD DNase family protein